jgi:hypothetical protein
MGNGLSVMGNGLSVIGYPLSPIIDRPFPRH